MQKNTQLLHESNVQEKLWEACEADDWWEKYEAYGWWVLGWQVISGLRDYGGFGNF